MSHDIIDNHTRELAPEINNLRRILDPTPHHPDNPHPALRQTRAA